MDRILSECIHTKEEDIQKIEIPVKEINDADKKDTALRNYSKDWLKRKVSHPLGVDTRFKLLPLGTSFYGDGGEIPVVGCLVLSFWPKKEESDFDKLKRQQKRNGFLTAGGKNG